MVFHAWFEAKEQVDAGKEATLDGVGGRGFVKQRLLRDVGTLVRSTAALLSTATCAVWVHADAAGAGLSAGDELCAAAARIDRAECFNRMATADTMSDQSLAFRPWF